MPETRFILEQLAQRKLGYALPPYITGQGILLGGSKKQVSNLSDTELVEIVTAKVDSEGFAQNPQKQPETKPHVFEGDNLKPSTAYVVNQIFPLKFKLETDSEYWTFPIEPLISIKGKNIITRRYVAKNKGRGSVKEYWAQDDYDITISGVFIHNQDAHAYPEKDVFALRRFCESGSPIMVLCPLLKSYGIFRMVIEDWDLPFTKGENIQSYTLKCLSDDDYELLIDGNIAIQ